MLETYLIYSGLFYLQVGANFPEWTHNSGKFVLGCCVKFNYGSLAELGTTIILKFSLTINLLHPIQDSIKQRNTSSKINIAAANVEVIAIAVIRVL